MESLSEYELQRLEHMRRNHEELVRLGLADPEPDPSEAPKPKAKRKRAPPPPPETLRRSGRVRQEKPEYTHEKIDAFGDELDRLAEKRPRQRQPAWEQPGEEGGEEDEEAERLQIDASTVRFLREAREALAGFVTSEDGSAPATADGWRAEAVRRWGDAVKADDWEVYVTSRLSAPPPTSPAPLLQEWYCADVWRLLCCCCLMSRVSSGATKHRCLAAFFALYPQPSAFLAAATEEKGSLAPLREAIHSLGLFDDRLKSLVAIARHFLHSADAFDVGLKPPHKIHGIGEFGYHSFLIFCRDEGATLRPNDKALAGFCGWRKRHAAAEAAAAEGTAAEGAASSSAAAEGVKEEGASAEPPKAAAAAAAVDDDEEEDSDYDEDAAAIRAAQQRARAKKAAEA